MLQWHHMATSAGVSADSVEGLRLNTLLDGLFHLATYAFVLAGLWGLWRAGAPRASALVVAAAAWAPC